MFLMAGGGMLAAHAAPSEGITLGLIERRKPPMRVAFPADLVVQMANESLRQGRRSMSIGAMPC